ncbi:MAG: response regulator transcription factor, partial [Firmicutes bacterium]|nr:response regulator transcription factor [Bacillota bacterium]
RHRENVSLNKCVRGIKFMHSLNATTFGKAESQSLCNCPHRSLRLNVAICEDEDLELKRLENILEHTDFEMNIFVFRNASEFVQTFEAKKYDLIFMDIYMPEITGVEVVENIRKKDKDVYISFCTTSVDHAIDGYRLNVERYLEKPVSQNAVIEVLERASSRRMTTKRRCVSLGKNTGLINTEDIVFAEQKNHTVYIHLSNGEMLHKTGTLDSLSTELCGTNFFRCHKSYIVNFDHVENIDRNIYVFEMKNGEKVPIKQREFPQIRDSFNEYVFSLMRNR